MQDLSCISGGHARTLMGLLYRCLQDEDPPLSGDCVERVIREHRDNIALAVTQDEWELIHRAVKQQDVSGEEGHKVFLRSLFVFEYHDSEGRWFDINPTLAETEKYKLRQECD